MNKITSRLIDGLSREVFLWLRCKVAHFEALRARANQFFKLDGLVEMVTRCVSEDFNGFLANASGYQNTQFQKLICPV